MATVSFVNFKKESIKNHIGAVSFVGGVVALCHLMTTYKTHNRVMLFLQASVILNGITSRPGLKICEYAAHRIATPQTLQKILGENTIFERNPWHIRHLANLTANGCAALGLILILFQKTKSPRFLQLLTLFNFLTGRSTLHIGNDLIAYASSKKRW